ncbi:MAG: S-formylglutathione hydrolase [Pseudomonadales bacterium]
MKKIGEHKCFGGRQLRFEHRSNVLACNMRFAVFLPQAAEHGAVPLLWWLSGLTCDDQNFVVKAGAQRYANQQGIAIICPDTSPRGAGVPDDAEGAWDFGLGAGFYVDATEKPWASHYRMYSYVNEELPALAFASLPLDDTRQAISGHSMGGHGALMIALKNPQRFRSVSAFAPIVAPGQCPWGEKALGNYLGNNKQAWREYDSCQLFTTIGDEDKRLPMLVDQGSADEFLPEQLKTELLEQAARLNNYPATVRYQAGYDHSYFFIASFIGEHIDFHATHLRDC